MITAEAPTLKERRQANMAKARAARNAKLAAQKSCVNPDDLITLVAGKAVAVPDPPPGLLPDNPVYRNVWRELLIAARSDPTLALSLIGNTKLREQAEAEAALQSRASLDLPEYLGDCPISIAVMLESIDSDLSALLRRSDLELPLSPTEEIVARWIRSRRGNAPVSIHDSLNDAAAHLALMMTTTVAASNDDKDTRNNAETQAEVASCEPTTPAK